LIFRKELSDVFGDYASADDGAANLALTIKRDRVAHARVFTEPPKA
jgi:hypothetical protein